MMRSIFEASTLKIKSISFKTILFSLFCLFLILIGYELILRIEGIRSQLPALSIGQIDRYPELDIKLQRLNELSKTETINCFLVGSSMVDAGIDPQILSLELSKSSGTNYHCFNFGLSGAMVETSVTIMEFLAAQYSPDLIIFGTSAIEFDRTFVETRELGQIPWIQYKLGRFSIEGWLVDHSLLYRSLLSLQKMSSPEFKEDYLWWDQLIDQYGLRVWTNQEMDRSGVDEILLYDFELNPVDLDQLESIKEFQNQGIKVEFVEMPIYPAHLDFYIEGGETSYDQLFVEPVTRSLQTQGNTLIRSQPIISEIVTEDGWYNKNHLNFSGAELFSAWLGQQINLDSQ